MKFLKVTILSIGLFLSTLTLKVTTQFLKTYGESCDGDCDEGHGLTCLPETKLCECMNPNATLYDHSKSSCVTKAGHPCRRIGTENHCVPHATCPALNLPCECDKNYFQTRNGTCAPVAKYGESCSSKKLCDKTAGMECVGNSNSNSSKNKQFKCQCKYPKDQYYDSEAKKCISYAGGNCSFSLPCVKNAGCSLEIFELRKGENLRGKSFYYNATVGKKCECLEGFRMTKNRLCLATYNSPCDDYDNKNVCNPEENLKCFDNKICLCQNPLQQVYHLGSHKCQNLVGAKCNNDDDCGENSQCRNSRCSCKVGYSVTPSRKCLKTFEQKCHSDECNIYRGLTCQNGTCTCLDEFLVFDQVIQSCLGREGSFCGSFSLSEEVGQRVLNFYPGIADMNACSKSGDKVKSFNVNCEDGFKCLSVGGLFQCVDTDF